MGALIHALVALLLLAAPASAQWNQGLFQRAGSAPTGATAWDLANCGLTLSSGNTVATAGASGTFSNCRSTTSRTGKLYFQLVEGISAFNYDWAGGVANASYGISGIDIGGTVNSIGCYDAIGSGPAPLYFNGTNVAQCSQSAMTNGSILEVAVDTTAGKYWSKHTVDTLWDNSGVDNPATGTGGISLSFASPFFIVVSLKSSAAATIVPHPTGCPAPSGFACWDP